MYIPAPIHDFFGYRGRNRQLHAMVGVIEAHVLEFPDQWIWTQYLTDLDSFVSGTKNAGNKLGLKLNNKL
jgi:hypothetical protein